MSTTFALRIQDWWVIMVDWFTTVVSFVRINCRHISFYFIHAFYFVLENEGEYGKFGFGVIFCRI
jgi:hypothetical protein